MEKAIRIPSTASGLTPAGTSSRQRMTPTAQTIPVTKNRSKVRSFLSKAGLHEVESFDTIHNYIDTDAMILRKGSISAREGERVLIPMNMRDGSLICIGKGNSDWNYSAPHGAGRLMSRNEAFKNLTLSVFKESMKDVFSTSVCNETLDEAPQVYKPMEEIIENIKDTVEIIYIM